MFYKKLKELRSKKDISQAELARSLGMSQQAIAKWETEKATPDPEMLIKIADFFGVTTDYLLGRDETNQESNTQKLEFSQEDLMLLHQIKRLTEDKRKIIDAVIQLNESVNEQSTGTSGK